ncbi:MAG: hypothetical protein AB7U85_08335 [Alphaproteobacteria bacterium]
MSNLTVVENFGGYQLCRQDETDEYLRVFRSSYIIKTLTGQKVGNVYPTLEDAQRVFEKIKQDL